MVEVIRELSEQLGVAIDWSNQNIIPYMNDLLHRYVQSEMIKSILWIVLFVSGIILVCVFLNNYKKNIKDESLKGNFDAACVVVIGILSVLICSFIEYIIEISIFPEQTFVQMLLELKN